MSPGPRARFGGWARPSTGIRQRLPRRGRVPTVRLAPLRAERTRPVHALLLSFGVIFVAELGDKSQLMALAFAARYRALPVLVGITVATAVVHAVSVLVGVSVGAALPTDAISIVAGLAFLAFGLWTLRGDKLTEEEAAKADQSNRSAVVAASVAFFLAELGDKTMLATITL